jgi:hypothetical protein
MMRSTSFFSSGRAKAGTEDLVEAHDAREFVLKSCATPPRELAE